MTSSLYGPTSQSSVSDERLRRTSSRENENSNVNGRLPPRQSRIGNLRGFLPLNEAPSSASLLTRQQNLPQLLGTGLIRRTSGIWYHEHETSTSGTDLRGGSGLTPSVSNEGPSQHGSFNNWRRSDEDETAVEDEQPTGHRRHSIGSQQRRMSLTQEDRAQILNTPQIRSQRLIGNSNPRYRWEQYWKTEEQLKKMKKPM
jgi:hypothetical protein